jgi:transcriptional regulator with XRE-family HTH domain
MVKLATWRKGQGMTQWALAKALDCSQSYVSQMERAHDALMPGKDMLGRIYALTQGAVEPNDFVDLPQLANKVAA